MSTYRLCYECSIKAIPNDLPKWQRAIMVAAFYMADREDMPCSVCNKSPVISEVDEEAKNNASQ
jgi:hypothetical protein